MLQIAHILVCLFAFNILQGHLEMDRCPGFGQYRINFHQEPGGNTAGRADPTWPNRARVFHTMCRHAGFWLGEAGWREGSCGSGGCGSGVGGESCSLHSAVLFCAFSLSVSLVLLLPWFAVLLNCPYPDPLIFACFFPFSSTPQQEAGAAERPRGPFVAGYSQTITICVLHA